MEPLGITSEHFAAFEPAKWSSNVYNLSRMRAKDALVALGRLIALELKESLHGLVLGSSDEIPNIVNHKKVDAQWIYWFRDPQARENLSLFLQKTKLEEATIFEMAPQDKHLCLAIVLRHETLWVGLHLAAGALVDRQNFAAKLKKSWERDHFLSLVAKLEGACLDGQALVTLTPEQIVEPSLHLGEKDPLWQLGYLLPKEDVLTKGPEIAPQLLQAITSLVPLYRFAAWSRENDHIEAGRQIQEDKAQKRKQAVGFQTGDKVRIVSGLFSGKVGVVQGIDAKAQVKVQVGKMAVVVSGTELRPI